ncbi:lysophospholipid acyltransferase family protein [Chitinophaga pinensis]|uniref:1-acylglycerol-3-phosphate O-acyltransferase n=1 Tax=Chitinophaga pinensis (strain ATCC 43595 / DSM 2588 / LMG 13176 / NBRC 15968 / NCIMB 11800 / UQM 2034) TaxID=485918 RepID=A0A979H125_CHIPD|nr:lysophospholipid acyltransferase family protein [Chitinophaga pinensis]ACU63980.1 1-acylglycerol-3-phosphate O-acyltransferase [Chitinophaga pinensis DSM 2588]
MKLLLKPLHVVYMIYAAIVFLVIMFLIIPPIFLASFLGRIKGGNIIFYFLRFWSYTWFPAVGIMVKRIYKHDKKDKTPYLYVVNHRSYLDAALAVQVMRLPFRPLGKIEMKRIPAFGYIYRQSVVMVDRSDAKARARSVREMISVIKEGVSILIFPEGTTNETDSLLQPFHNGAFRIAIETQTPIQPVLYLDNGKRLHAKGFNLNPGRCRVVYLPPVPVAGLTMEDLPALKQQVFNIMEQELKATV